MNSEHYLSKIVRNTNVLDKIPENKKYRDNIIWARELSDRLAGLDYIEREKAISMIHEVMDANYKEMGFNPVDNLLEDNIEKSM